MPQPFSTLLPPERAHAGRRAGWLTLVGLVLVPLTVGGLLTWALWQPLQRLDRVQAAVVNQDVPVELDGQTVPLGRQLAAALVTSAGTADDAAGTDDTAGTDPDAVANVSGLLLTVTFTWCIAGSGSTSTSGMFSCTSSSAA